MVNDTTNAFQISLDKMSHVELQKILAQLEQALYNHQQWYKELIRTLICRSPSDKHDISSEAHKECRFGQWYYSSIEEKIHNYPGFISIGNAHMRMHQLATHLLITINSATNITTLDYDQFANSVEQMRLEISALKIELENLLYNCDPLTGAINRINMLPILREQQAIVKRQKQPCCLAMLDLDHFKNVNDQCGHQIGDIVLASTAHYISENIRSYDKLFRYGGEEFLICFPFTELSIANEMIERIRKGLAIMSIDISPKESIHITVSIGLALLDSSLPVEESIEHADKAMYKAKSSGRNCTQLWQNNLTK